MNGTLTAGYDGSAPSMKAVLWAADEAARLGAGLRIVSCYSTPIGSDPWIASSSLDYDLIAETTRSGLSEIAQTVANHHADLDVETDAVLGDARTGLVERARGSRLLVVGTSGAGALRSFLLGSIAQAVVRDGQCPVVLVPDADPRAPSNRIVVGTDGSPAAAAAVAWATDEADLRNDELIVVHAWNYPYHPNSTESQGRDLTRIDAALLLEESVASSRERGRGPVRGVLVEDHPAAALLEVGGDVDLIVVGSRGRGGFRALLFGSVAHAVSHHATCPTVIVHTLT